MKKNFLFAMAIAAAFTACSDDNEAMNDVQAGATKGYMTFNVELPSMATTRAANDDFAEGAAEEYYVGDMHIVLLDGDNKILQVESDLTTQWENPTGETNNVERISASISVKTDVTPSKALVILNKPTNVSLVKDQTWDNELSLTENTSVSMFYDSNTATNKVAKGITMTNAAIVVDGSIQDLQPITAENIKNTQAEAAQNPVTVYVERVIAKVSVSQSPTELEAAETNSPVPVGIGKISIDNWKLDITNKSTYLMRQYETSWSGDANYVSTKLESSSNGGRMIGTATNPVRVYWAKDLNYSNDNKTTTENVLAYTYGFEEITSSTTFNALTDVEYCLENTFDVANQMQDQTTRVVFATTIYQPDVETATDLFTVGSGSTLYNAENLINVIANVAKEQGVSIESSSLQTTLTVDAAGTYELTTENLKTMLGLSTDLTAEQVNAINSALGTITCYKGGKCYYAARIKHFGDDLTPWNSTDPNYGSDDNATKNWLGRYGVVRNNWYELTVTAIKKIGYATVEDIPEDPTTPDDEKTQYMEFKINILSWAKRAQEVVL